MWQDKLVRLKEMALAYGDTWQSGLSATDLSQWQKVMADVVPELPLDSYRQVLSVTNGFEFDGTIFYGFDPDQKAEQDMFAMNAVWHENEGQRQYFFIAENAISWYVFDRESKVFAELDLPSGDVMAQFADFDRFMEEIVAGALNDI